LGIDIQDSLKPFVWEQTTDKKAKLPFQTPITVYDALKKFVDLHGAVSKKILKSLSDCTSDYVEKQDMLKMVNSKEYLQIMVTDK